MSAMGEKSGLLAKFSPRMRFLSIFAAICIILAIPLTFFILGWDAQGWEANGMSEEIAAKVADTVRKNPELWKYSVIKFMEAFDAVEAREVVQARIYDADGVLLESKGFYRGALLSRTGGADIVYNNVRFGHVEVDKRADVVLYAALGLAAIFLPLSLAFSLLMYFYPKSVIKKAETQIDGMLDRLNLEVSDGKAKEERIGESLREKEILLKEIHHRVKNNLQIIISLINLRIGTSEDEKAKRMLKDIERKVRAMALAHEQLYESPTLSRIGMDDYLRSLVSAYRDAYDLEGLAIEYRVDASDISLTLELAMPIGLIVSELVTNCQKHAFAGRDRGRIDIVLARSGEGFRLVVADDGIGMAGDSEEPPTNRLGHLLIESLAAQIRGELIIDSSRGFEVRVEGIPDIAG